ncbi:MAG: tetratricopeptide repeat protein [Spirochaetales bacterium]|nr:tetratricopeptide repeat protein [Spirochaetales bacterium]
MNVVFYLLVAAAAGGLAAGGIILAAQGRSSPAMPRRAGGGASQAAGAGMHQRAERGADQRAGGGAGRAAQPRSGRRHRASLARAARRRLEAGPEDPDALLTLAELAYHGRQYREAFAHYRTLASLNAASPPLDPFRVNLRLGQTALELGDVARAREAFLAARRVNDRDFEVNYNLGRIELRRRSYAGASACLEMARKANPDHPEANRHLGASLYFLKMYPRAVQALEKALDFTPGDTEAQYLLGRSYLALGQAEAALGIFSRLRQDRRIGAAACLYAGTIHARARRFREAAEEFQRGLRRPATPEAVTLELKYRLAAVRRGQGKLARSVRLWREIARARPGYKDVEQRLAKEPPASRPPGHARMRTRCLSSSRNGTLRARTSTSPGSRPAARISASRRLRFPL